MKRDSLHSFLIPNSHLPVFLSSYPTPVPIFLPSYPTPVPVFLSSYPTPVPVFLPSYSTQSLPSCLAILHQFLSSCLAILHQFLHLPVQLSYTSSCIIPWFHTPVPVSYIDIYLQVHGDLALRYKNIDPYRTLGVMGQSINPSIHQSYEFSCFERQQQ